MPETTRAQLDRTVRELYDKGHTAYQRDNLDYAIAIFNQVLQSEPGLYECREALRATQFRRIEGKRGIFKRFFGAAKGSPSIAKAQMQIRSNPREAMRLAESVLNDDPNNASAHKILAEAALEADFPKTAVLSLEIAHKNSPQDREIAVDLAEALARSGQIEKAENIYRDLQKAFPTDPSIGQAFKNITARRSMKEGGYEALSQGGSYRDILRNEQEAISIEQEGREIKTSEAAERLLKEYEAKLEKEPDNRKLLRSIAQLYADQKRFDEALQYYDQITSKEGHVDASLEKAVSETRIRQFNHRIEQIDPDSPEAEATKNALIKERDEFELKSAKDRMERFPNDLQLRFDLGKLYFERGEYQLAIPEFQKAQVNPHRKIHSLYYLGRAFSERRMHDLALRTLQSALKEKTVFDNEKKDLLYALGETLERLNKPAEAIDHYKQIYEVDVNYRDVAAKVDAFYAQGETDRLPPA